MSGPGASCLFFVGSYTRAYGPFAAGGEGVYLCELLTESGEMRQLAVTPDGVNPAYLVVDASGRHLYAVQETPEDQEPGVVAYRIGPDGGLRRIGRQPSRGSLPCHLSLDGSGRWLALASYGGGSVQLHPVRQDGTLGPICGFAQHRGRSVHPTRQAGPHAHAAVFDSSGDHLLVPDLGLDEICCYRVDAAGALLAREPAWTAPAGSGPRQLAWHPGGRHAFVVCELSSRLVAMGYRRGRLTALCECSTLPAAFRGENTAAAVRVHPSGRIVYASNRGHDSLAVFRFDVEQGKRLAQHVPTEGSKPRDLTLDPSGRWLVVGNHHGGGLVSFAVEERSGELSPSGYRLSLPSPACLAPLPAAARPATGSTPG